MKAEVGWVVWLYLFWCVLEEERASAVASCLVGWLTGSVSFVLRFRKIDLFALSCLIWKIYPLLSLIIERGMKDVGEEAKKKRV